MKRLCALLVVSLAGCSALPGQAAAPPYGFFYTGAKGVGPASRAVVSDGVRPGPKQGKACASGVLGLAAWGDMSVDSAKKAGGITRVDTVDFSTMSIVGVVYVKNCTLITGE